MRRRTTGAASIAAILVLTAGAWSVAVADEASSPNFVLEVSAFTSGGGTSQSAPGSRLFSAESAGYELTAALGQPIDTGTAESASFNADAGLYNDVDLDGDGVLGIEDLCPEESASCWDLDHDGCVDLPDPDGDGDGVTAGACDCDDGNPFIWGRPSEVGGLSLVHDGVAAITTLNWLAPLEPGGTPVAYDVLRSPSASDFVGSTICLESGDDTDSEAVEFDDPAAGSIFYYLVRAANACAYGSGTIGYWSNQVVRPGRDCG